MYCVVSPVNCGCIIHSVFGGTLRSDVQCGSCGNISSAIDPTFDLSLDLHSLPITQPSTIHSTIISTGTTETTPTNAHQEATPVTPFSHTPSPITVPHLQSPIYNQQQQQQESISIVDCLKRYYILTATCIACFMRH